MHSFEICDYENKVIFLIWFIVYIQILSFPCDIESKMKEQYLTNKLTPWEPKLKIWVTEVKSSYWQNMCEAKWGRGRWAEKMVITVVFWLYLTYNHTLKRLKESSSPHNSGFLQIPISVFTLDFLIFYP